MGEIDTGDVVSEKGIKEDEISDREIGEDPDKPVSNVNSSDYEPNTSIEEDGSRISSEANDLIDTSANEEAVLATNAAEDKKELSKALLYGGCGVLLGIVGTYLVFLMRK